MKSLIRHITESLKINSKSKVNTVRYLSKKDIPEHFFDNFTAHEGDLDKFEKEIFHKKDPNELVKNIKYKEQLFIYWYDAVYNGWKKAYDIFRTEIINKGYAKENELDSTAIEIMQMHNGDKTVKNNVIEYLDNYNVKIKE